MAPKAIMFANFITPAVSAIVALCSFANLSGASPTLASCGLQSSWTVSIYRKADTARLDTFIGPKSIAVPWNDGHYTA